MTKMESRRTKKRRKKRTVKIGDCVSETSPSQGQSTLIGTCVDSVNGLSGIEDGKSMLVEWILDSGCGRHLTGTPELLGNSATKANTALYLPDGSQVESTKVGDVILKMETEDCDNNVVISGVELIPGFKKNLLSYVRLETKGIRMVYVGKTRYLANERGDRLTEVHESGNLLVIRSWFNSSRSNAELICSAVASQDHGEARA